MKKLREEVYEAPLESKYSSFGKETFQGWTESFPREVSTSTLFLPRIEQRYGAVQINDPDWESRH